jgi:hypothetical protein
MFSFRQKWMKIITSDNVQASGTTQYHGCREIVLPSTIHTVIITKYGRKSSIAV